MSEIRKQMDPLITRLETSLPMTHKEPEVQKESVTSPQTWIPGLPLTTCGACCSPALDDANSSFLRLRPRVVSDAAFSSDPTCN